MTRRSELALCAYTLAVVLLAFTQYAHESWEVGEPAAPTAVLVASAHTEVTP